jgi:5'-nucleotidase
VPVLVFSAGLGDVVQGIMRYYSINKINVHVISNFFKTDESENIIGFQDTLIHIYNKNQHAIENSDYFEVFMKY